MQNQVTISNMEKAMAQYAKEEKEYNEFIGNQPYSLALCAGTLLHMRESLTPFQKCEAMNLLCDNTNHPGSLSDIQTILHREEYLAFPYTMKSFLSDMIHDILDDGYIGFSRLVILDDVEEWSRENNGLLSNVKNRTVIHYALWSGEKLIENDAKVWAEFNKNKTHFLRNPKLVSCQSDYIETIDEFLEILNTLDDQNSYDEHGYLKTDGILDEFFKKLQKNHHTTEQDEDEE